MKPTTNRVYSLCVTALFAAILAVLSPLSIPLPFTPVPLSLGTFAVYLAAAAGGVRWGTLSVAVYLLLGAVGIPVFAGYSGGLQVLVGPTGGYLIGYLPLAFFGRAAHRPFPRAEIHLPLVNDRRNILLLCHWHLVACPASLPLPAWSAGGRGAPLSSGGWGENPRGVCHRLSSAPGPLSEEGEFSPTKKGGLA